MRLDPVVERRFAELADKADKVSQTRYVDFVGTDGTRHYKVASAAFIEWATNVQNLLARVFGTDSVHYVNFAARSDQSDLWESQFQDCVAIFAAAREDYEGGYLFNVRSLAKAEVLSDAFAQAQQLLEAGYKDPACVLARVALESALKEIAATHGVALGKLDRMNADLCKAGVYNMVKQKQITAWADIGNKAAHGDWNEYSGGDVRFMVTGVQAFVADLL